VRADELLVRARVAALGAERELSLVGWTALHTRYYTAVERRVPATFAVMARLVGINHVALEVGDVDEALAWYGRFFEFELRGRMGSQMAFVDIGDQFIAFARDANPHIDRERHFGLVVDDKDAARRALEDAGVELTRAPNCSFRDPWGNHVQVVDYREIQFTKSDRVLEGMGLSGEKSERALAELREKGLGD
jgi:predicted enzyme related to lactoylglutathione lyase